MLKQNAYPDKFDSYGRHITRESIMDTAIRRTKENNCNNNCNINSGNSSTSNNENLSCCNVHNSAMYLKYGNLRIKFVGFIYDRINYIVDLDNRKVMFKPIKEVKYQQLQCRMNVTSDNLTNSYKLGFHLYKSYKIANVEVYPNDIENCNVIITDRNTHSTDMLDKDYIAFEFFDAKNMLDEKGNIITFVNYQDIFKLNEQKLMTLFTYTESICFIKSILDNVMNSKDLVEVVKKLLIDIRTKYTDYVNHEGCFNPDCPSIGDEEFDIPDDDCCEHHHHHHEEHLHPDCPPVKPPHHPHPHRPSVPVIDEKDVIGTYYNRKDNSVIILGNKNEAFFSLTSEDSILEWSLYYSGDINCDIIDDVIVELYDITTDDRYKFSYNPKSRVLKNASDGTQVFERDIKEIPSLDFTFIGNDYIDPTLIIKDGNINEDNGSIEIVEDYDNFKSVEVQMSKKYVVDKGILKFLFKENNTFMVDNNVFLTEDIDFNDENPEYKYWFKKPLSYDTLTGCGCNHTHHKKEGLHILKLKDNIITSIRDGVITNIYTILKCKYKEDLTSEEYLDRLYQINIKLV